MEAEQNHNNGRKVRLLCSYGGKIKSRPTDHQLSYVGGDTKIIAVDRAVKFSEIVAKLNSLTGCCGGGEISVKYQLPGEDLDSLVSLIDDEDVEHMMVEYDRMQRISAKPPPRLRIFVFAAAAAAAPSPPAKPDPNPDYLFGFDKEYQPSVGPPAYLSQAPPENGGRFGSAAGIPTAAAQAVNRVPGGVSECVYRNGVFAFGGANNGNRQQPVYNLIPVMPPVSEQRMSIQLNNGSRRNF